MIFEYDAKCSTNGKNWYSNIVNICKATNMAAELENHEVIHLEKAKTELLRMYEVVWRKEVDKKPKLQLYKHLKTDLKTANYLKCNLRKDSRAILCRMCLGALQLD